METNLNKKKAQKFLTDKNYSLITAGVGTNYKNEAINTIHG